MIPSQQGRRLGFTHQCWSAWLEPTLGTRDPSFSPPAHRAPVPLVLVPGKPHVPSRGPTAGEWAVPGATFLALQLLPAASKIVESQVLPLPACAVRGWGRVLLGWLLVTALSRGRDPHAGMRKELVQRDSSHCPCRGSADTQMRFSQTWFRGRLGSAGLTVGSMISEAFCNQNGSVISVRAGIAGTRPAGSAGEGITCSYAFLSFFRYFLIERGKNMCGLAACASYPVPQV